MFVKSRETGHCVCFTAGCSCVLAFIYDPHDPLPESAISPHPGETAGWGHTLECAGSLPGHAATAPATARSYA